MATTLDPTYNNGKSYTPELTVCINDNHDACSKCGRQFQGGEQTYLGRDETGALANTCADCSTQFVELISKEPYLPRAYAIPPRTASLWRYMDFAKYVSVLSAKALFFTPASGFEDKFEGAMSVASSKGVWAEGMMPYYRNLLKRQHPDWNEAQIESFASKTVEIHAGYFKTFRSFQCVSCWHENESESVAMWDLYSKDYSNAIAIRTTYRRLYESLNSEPGLQIGRVNYIDYRTQFPDLNHLFFYKRKSYQHENEVRAVIQDRAVPFPNLDDTETKGILMPVDLNLLIEKVYVSPQAPDRLVKLVESVNAAFGFPDIMVEKSELGEIPC